MPATINHPFGFRIVTERMEGAFAKTSQRPVGPRLATPPIGFPT